MHILSFSQFSTCSQVQVLAYGEEGEEKQKKPLLPAVPWNFSSLGNYELGRSYRFSPPLDYSTLAQKSQMQLYFKCSLPFISLVTVWTYWIFWISDVSNSEDLRRQSGSPAFFEKAAFLASSIWAHAKKLGKMYSICTRSCPQLNLTCKPTFVWFVLKVPEVMTTFGLVRGNWLFRLASNYKNMLLLNFFARVLLCSNSSKLNQTLLPAI